MEIKEKNNLLIILKYNKPPSKFHKPYTNENFYKKNNDFSNVTLHIRPRVINKTFFFFKKISNITI